MSNVTSHVSQAKHMIEEREHIIEGLRTLGYMMKIIFYLMPLSL